MRTVAVEDSGRNESALHGAAERRMWCAVISRALQDALNDVATVSSLLQRDKLREDARKWFIGNDAEFQAACNAAGYDPEVLRPRVLRLIGTESLRL